MSETSLPDTATSTPAPATRTSRDGAERHMLESLVCPLTQSRLELSADKSELISKAAHMAFPIRDGIPVMLVSEAREIKD